MASTARPVRTSARQTAIKQQEKEAEQRALEAKLKAKRERELLLEQQRLEKERKQKEEDEEEERLRKLRDSSSRSLSPPLSDASSLSDVGDDDDEDEEEAEEEEETEDEEAEEDDPNKEQPLSSYWEIAFVYGFLVSFKSLLKQACPLKEFTIDDLELGLQADSSNPCLEDIHCNLLSNLPNRKKAVTPQVWQKVLSETLDAKLKTGELLYTDNPMRFYNGDYYAIPTKDRVLILKALVDWVLQEGPSVRWGIDQEMEAYVVKPFGQDQTKRVYWYFGEGTVRLYRETNSKKKNAKWETVANNLDELVALANSFDKTSSRLEKTLQERLRNEIIAPANEKILRDARRKERQEKQMRSLALYHEMAATRSTRTRSSNRLNAPKYTFDDEEEEDEEDEFAMYRRPSSRNSRRKLNDAQEQDGQHEEQSQSIVDEHREGDGDQDHSLNSTMDHKDRELSVSSSRSSVGRDSDSSIRVAFERTKVQDGEDDSSNEHAAQVSEEVPEASTGSPHSVAMEVLPTAVLQTTSNATPVPIASPLNASDVVPAIAVVLAPLDSTPYPDAEPMDVDRTA
ncbi:hypothetical protein EMPS_03033 [Entomortierella parvispora]|uniref:DDT domain-containing protein n=1 Tax=Entomortierella parvispora TaxID=205924 RepID=A0A9P3H617_9FUNG|nr:hypothetical protein EMPS_03033 [Entomortierella parvispora]